MFPLSATLVLLAVVGCCTYSVSAVHHVDITVLPDGNQNISTKSDQNVTYTCSISEGNVVWQVEEYQLIDRDEFSAQGIMIQEHEDGDFSEIIMRPEGYRFLSEQFSATSFRLQCTAVLDDVNVIRGKTQNVTVYVDAGDEVPNPGTATDSDGVTTVMWDRPDVDDLVPITYNITVRNLPSNEQLHQSTTDDTQVALPTDVTCALCEITITAANDANSTSIAFRTSIPTSPNIGPITTPLKCTTQAVEITVTYPDPTVVSGYLDVENSTVTLYDGTGISQTRQASAGNGDIEVPFSDLSCDGIYSVKVSACTDSYCRDSETISITRALRCQVTYFRTNVALNCSFSPGTECECSPWEVQFVFTINSNRSTFNVIRSKAESGYTLNETVAGDDVVAYMWHPERGPDTQPIPTDVVTVDNEDDFPGDVDERVEEEDDDDDVCGTTCIIIVVIVGVVCLLLGVLLGVFLGFCLYKYCCSKNEKRFNGTELAQKTEKLYP